VNGFDILVLFLKQLLLRMRTPLTQRNESKCESGLKKMSQASFYFNICFDIRKLKEFKNELKTN